MPQQLWPLLANQDPGRALLMADQTNPAALQGLAAQVAPDAATLASTLLNVQDSSDKEISLACLETTLSGLPPERVQAMMAECAQLADDPRKDKIYAAALGAWTRQEPAAALAQVNSMDDAEMKRIASLTVIQTLGASAETNAEHLPSLLSLMDAAVPDDASATKSQDIATCETALAKLTRANPEAVLDWLQVQKDWQSYNRWLPHVLAGMATANPAQAVSQAVVEPNEKVRHESISAAVGQWIQFDPKAASVWARALPEGPERAAAALTLAKGIARVEPTSAYPWALEAAPGQQRQDLLTAIFEQWEEDDPGAPSRIVPSTMVDDALQADLEAAWKEAHP